MNEAKVRRLLAGGGTLTITLNEQRDEVACLYTPRQFFGPRHEGTARTLTEAFQALMWSVYWPAEGR